MDDSMSLRELVDADIVQAIQDSFAKTVGVSSVIFLPDGDALTRFSNPIKFCSLIQSTKEGRRRCFQSFAEMSRKAVELSEPEVMYCFAHGAHFVAPIIIDGERKATMYAGQFRPDEFSPEQLKELEKIAVEIDLDPELLVKEAKNMRTVGDAIVMDCLRSFFRTVKAIAELGAQAAELHQTKDTLQKAHDELETRVQKRTSELAGANEELRQEIAERKITEDALRESEEKLRSIAEQSGDGIVLVDEEGIIIEWNPGQERITGLSLAEVLGRPVWGVMSQMAANEPDNPALYERIKAGVLKILETGQSEWLDRLDEREVRRPDGVRRVIQVAVFPIKTGKGFMAGAISRDITERKQAEEALRESEARIRALLNASTNAMILIDSAGIVLAVNNAHAEWVKKSIDEIIGNCIFDSFPSDIAEFRKAQTSVVFNTGKPIHFEESQREKIFNTNVYPVFGTNGKVTAVAVHAQNITERKQAEDALRASEEKLRSIAEQSGDGIVLVDEEGTTIEWNRGQEQITGLSREDVLGRPIWDIMFRVAANEPDNPALYERIKAGVLKILETGQSEGLDRMEAREVRRPDGVRRVIQVAVFPIKTGKGFMAGAISRDITEYKQAEDALLKSEEKYRVLFETAKDAIFLSDETGKFVDVNRAACESLGYSREELLRLSNREIDADPIGYDAFLKVRDTPAKEAIFEVNQRRKDKTLRSVEITGKFFKVNGELLALAIARDITERKLAEAELRESEGRYRLLTENAKDMIYRMSLPEGIYEYVSPASVELTGYKPTEFYDSPHMIQKTIHPNWQQFFEEEYAKLVVGDMQPSYEYQIIHKSGETRWLYQRNVLISDDKGRPSAIEGIVTDITERKLAEEALRASEEKLRSIVEQSCDGIMLADEQGTIIEWNRGQEQITGLSRAEVLGRPVWDVLFRMVANDMDNPAAYEQIKASVREIIETGQSEWLDRLDETVFQRPDGTRRVVQAAVFPIPTDKGFMAGAISRDITEREAAEEQIKRSLREKDVLMHEIHHRVKNNLQVVSSLLSMQAQTTRNKEAIDVLSKSQSRINTMSLIHTQLYESGDLSELNMKEFVGTLSEQLFRSYLVNDTKIARIVHVTDCKFPASVGVHVGLIIHELLSNALEHAFVERTGGKIEVSLIAPDSGRVNLRVSDDGVGLPSGFDIDKTRSLGLHLVKILVEDQLQGTLEVISDGGVTFNMEFDIDCNV